MNDETQKHCKRLIRKYQKYRTENKWKAQCRNELYEVLRPWMLRWIQAILKKWGRYEENGELLALTWDAFYDCLERHNGSDVHVPKYFYEFTRYYLLVHYAQKEDVTVPLEEFQQLLPHMPSGLASPLTKLIDVYSLLDEAVLGEHKFIFYDAMQSIYPGDKLRVWSWKKDCGVTQTTYAELKKAFKEIIKWVLKK